MDENKKKISPEVWDAADKAATLILDTVQLMTQREPFSNIDNKVQRLEAIFDHLLAKLPENDIRDLLNSVKEAVIAQARKFERLDVLKYDLQILYEYIRMFTPLSEIERTIVDKRITEIEKEIHENETEN